MRTIEQIKEKIEEAKRLKVAQQFDVDMARDKWQKELEKQRETLDLIRELQDGYEEENTTLQYMMQ